MATQSFKTSPYGRMLLAKTGLGPPLRLARFGCSHVANYYHRVVQYAFARTDPNVYDDMTQVYVEGAGGQANDAQVTLATSDRAKSGSVYATGGTSPDHLVNTQLVQFNLDVAAGRRWDIGLSDGSLFNSTRPSGFTDQQWLDQVDGKLNQVISAFLDGPNQGLYFFVRGTFNFKPRLAQAWANMQQKKAAASGGRIRFLDSAKVLIDPAVMGGAGTNTQGVAGTAASPEWYPKGGYAGLPSATVGFGQVQGDPAHLSAFGAWLDSEELSIALIEVAGRRVARDGSYTVDDYDSTNNRYSDLLGPNAGMVGSAGYDVNTVADANLPGTGHAGADVWKNRWNILAYSGVGKPATAAPPLTPNGNRQISLTFSGNAAANATMSLGCIAQLADFGKAVAGRKFMVGIELEYVNVTGAQLPRLDITTGTPVASPVTVYSTAFHVQSQADSLPDNFSGVLRLRTPAPIDMSSGGAANPGLSILFPWRQKTGISGTILVRLAYFRLAEE